MSVENTADIQSQVADTNPSIDKRLAYLTGNMDERTRARHQAVLGPILIFMSIPMVQEALDANDVGKLLFGMGLTYLGISMIQDAKDIYDSIYFKESEIIHESIPKPNTGIRKKNLLYLNNRI